MMTVAEIGAWLNQQAPPSLGEPWDNIGLLIGDGHAQVRALMTCLTLDQAVIDEAIQSGAQLIIAHHPVPFKPLSRITTESVAGNRIWQLARHGISLLSPHTAWDSAENGINAMLAQRLGLLEIQPLIPSAVSGLDHLGVGRAGYLKSAFSLAQLCGIVKSLLPNCRLRGVDSGKIISKVGIACGSGGSLLPSAVACQCDLLLTGEATYHTCLDAQASNMSLLLTGHFASEQFAMAELAKRLSSGFPALKCWSSQAERDPVQNFH